MSASLDVTRTGRGTAGGQTRRAAQAAETRKRIIDAAVALYKERVYRDVGAADVAAAAGVAHGLIFHYFGSMRGLYLETMRGAAERLARALQFSPSGSPSTQLREGLTAHVRYLSAHRGLALRLVLGGRGADPEAWEVFEAARWRMVETTAASFGADPQRPAVRMVGRAVIAAIDEATVFWLENGEPFPKEDLVNWMVRTTFRSLAESDALDPALADNSALMTALLESAVDARRDGHGKAPSAAKSRRGQAKATSVPRNTRRATKTAGITKAAERSTPRRTSPTSANGAKTVKAAPRLVNSATTAAVENPPRTAKAARNAPGSTAAKTTTSAERAQRTAKSAKRATAGETTQRRSTERASIPVKMSKAAAKTSRRSTENGTASAKSTRQKRR